MAVQILALDAEGVEVTEPPVEVQVADLSIARWDGELRCLMSGDTVLRASSGEHSIEVPVHCSLVLEVRLPERLLVEPGPLDALDPELLGDQGQVIEHPWSLSSTDTAVVDGLQAKAPGEATVTVTAGDLSDKTRVLVGHWMKDEVVSTGLEQGQVYPLEPGLYVVRTQSDSPAGVAFVGGPESCRSNGLVVELECRIGAPAELRVQNLNAAGSWEGRIQVFSVP